MCAPACYCVVCGIVCAQLIAFKLSGKERKNAPKRTINWNRGEQQSHWARKIAPRYGLRWKKWRNRRYGGGGAYYTELTNMETAQHKQQSRKKCWSVHVPLHLTAFNWTIPSSLGKSCSLTKSRFKCLTEDLPHIQILLSSFYLLHHFYSSTLGISVLHLNFK